MAYKRHPSRSIVNFSAGPSALPYEVNYFNQIILIAKKYLKFLLKKVLEKAQIDLINYDGTETSVMGQSESNQLL